MCEHIYWQFSREYCAIGPIFDKLSCKMAVTCCHMELRTLTSFMLNYRSDEQYSSLLQMSALCFEWEMMNNRENERSAEILLTCLERQKYKWEEMEKFVQSDLDIQRRSISWPPIGNGICRWISIRVQEVQVSTPDVCWDPCWVKSAGPDPADKEAQLYFLNSNCLICFQSSKDVFWNSLAPNVVYKQRSYSKCFM